MLTGQHVSWIFTGIFLFIVLIGLLKGLRRGAARQTVRTVTIVVSAVLSITITGAITASIAAFCEGKTLAEVVAAFNLTPYLEESLINLLDCFDAVTAERLVDLPLLTLIMPFIFTGCFMVLSAILMIVHGIVSAILRFSGKRARLTSRLIGMAIGAAQGLAVAVIFTLPIINIINITSLAQATIAENRPEEAESNAICVVYDDYMKETKENPVFAFASVMGADALCDSFATVEIGEEKVNLRTTISRFLGSFDDFAVRGEYDWTNPTEEQCDALKSVISDLAHDNYIASIMSGATRGVAIAIGTGVISLEMEEPALSVMENIVSIFTTLNEQNFANDIDTILDVYIMLAREQILLTLVDGSTEDITEAFISKNEAGETVIKRVITKIQNNEHMKPLVTMLTKLSISIMMNDVGVEQGDEVYETVREGVSNVISIDKSQYETDEEYVDAVSESLDTTLKNHDIELAPEIVDNMAEYITNQDYADFDIDEVTDEEVNDVILSYYEAYLDYVNNGGENPFPGLNMGGGE